MSTLLNYGITGLGAYLACLAYQLLVQEQKREHFRSNVYRSACVFMGFSLVLCVLGLASERFSDTDREVMKDQVLLANSVGRFFRHHCDPSVNPDEIFGMAQNMVAQFSTESLDKIREDANKKQGNSAEKSAVHLVESLQLSPSTKNKNRAFRQLTGIPLHAECETADEENRTADSSSGGNGLSQPSPDKKVATVSQTNK